MRSYRIRAAVFSVVCGGLALFGLSTTAEAAPKAPSAPAQPILAKTAQGLKSDPFFIYPTVTERTLDNAKVAELRDAIKAGPHPIYIAVLPSAVSQEASPKDGKPDASSLPVLLAKQTGLAGVYAVWVSGTSTGGLLRAVATDSAGVPQAAVLADVAFNAHKGDAAGALKQFVDQVEKQPVVEGSVTKSPPFPWLTVVLCTVGGVIVLIIVIVLVRRRRAFSRRKARLDRQMNELRAELLDCLFLDLNAIESFDKANGHLTTARTELDKAASMYDLDQAEQDLESAQTALQEAQGFEDMYQESLLADERPDARPSDYFDVFGERREQGSDKGQQAQPAFANPKPTPAAEAPSRTAQPQKIVNVTNYYNVRQAPGHSWSADYYPGRDYGYWPGFGWGFWGWDNQFYRGRLADPYFADGSHGTIVIINHDYVPDRENHDERDDPIASDADPNHDTTITGEVGGSGDFGSVVSEPLTGGGGNFDTTDVDSRDGAYDPQGDDRGDQSEPVSSWNSDPAPEPVYEQPRGNDSTGDSWGRDSDTSQSDTQSWNSGPDTTAGTSWNSNDSRGSSDTGTWDSSSSSTGGDW